MLRLVVNDETCVPIEGLEIQVGVVRKRDNRASVAGLHGLHAPPVWKNEKNERKMGYMVGRTIAKGQTLKPRDLSFQADVSACRSQLQISSSQDLCLLVQLGGDEALKQR